MPQIERWFAAWIIRYRWWFLLLTPIIVFGLSAGMQNLKFTTDYRVFFSEKNPQRVAFEEFEKTYNQNDSVIFLLIPKEGDIFTKETLAAVEDLTEEAWQLPYSLRVDSITNFQYTEADGDDLLVRDLVKNATELTNAEIERVREIVLSEPLLAERLVPLDTAGVTTINATIQLPRIDETQEVPEVVASARTIADQIRGKYPHLDVRLNGMVLMNNAFSEAAKVDSSSLIPLSFLIMLVVLMLLLRVAVGTIAIALVIIMSIMVGMGVGGYMGMPITPPSSVSPIIILTMAIANSVHVLVVYHNRVGEGMERLTAMQESLRINLTPIFLTTLTTIVGFLAINLSEVPPFRHLANFVAFGVGASFILSITFLPALMSLFPVKARKKNRTSNRLMDGFANFVISQKGRLLWGMGVLMVVLIAFVPKNELNDAFVQYFDQSIEFRRDSDILDKHLGGLYSIDFSLDTGESNGIHEPAFLRKVDDFTEWLRAQPEITHVNSITDTFKRLNKNLHADDPAYYRLPDERAMAAQFLLLYEMSLPYGLDLNNQINVDKSATRIQVSMHITTTRKVQELNERISNWLKTNAQELVADGTGPTVMFAYIAQRNIYAMLKATSIALVLISIILIVALRSVRIGLVSMVPNLVPAGMAFGIWGLLVGEIGLALSVVSAMTIGIVVDDTIHLLSKYLRARREEGASPEQAVRYAFSHVGIALTITSFTLIVGFLVLTLSSFVMNSDMGLMVALVLFMALAADFLFLPPLLMKLEKNK